MNLQTLKLETGFRVNFLAMSTQNLPTKSSSSTDFYPSLYQRLSIRNRLLFTLTITPKMFRKIKKTFRNNASGKQQFEDCERLLAGSEQLQSSHQGTHQSNKKAPNLPFLSLGRRRNNRDPRSLSSAQETRVPQTPQYIPSSPEHPPCRNQHSSSRSIQSNENGRPSTSTRAESVRSSSASHHTTSNVSRTKRHP